MPSQTLLSFPFLAKLYLDTPSTSLIYTSTYLDHSMSDGIRDLSGINLEIPARDSSQTNSSPSDDLTPLPELPAAPPSKTYGTAYNAYHPVPTVAGYQDVVKENEKAADEYARIVAQRQKEQEARQARMSEQAQAVGGKQEHHDEAGSGSHGENEAKMRKDNKLDTQGGNNKVNEKQRMMDQMNSNQGLFNILAQ